MEDVTSRLTHRLSALVAAALALLIALPLAAEPKPPKKLDTDVKEPQVFRYKYAAGQERSYDTTMVQKLNMQSQSSDPGIPSIDTSSSMEAVMTMTTRKVKKDGSAVIVSDYDDIKLELRQNGMELPKRQMGPIKDMLSKLKTTSNITTRGKAEAIDFKGANAGMRQFAESIKRALIGTTPVFPKQGLKVGDTWTQEVPMDIQQGPISLTMDFRIKYTFLGFAEVRGVRAAVFSTDLETSINDRPSTKGGMKLSLSGSGQGDGVFYFDNEAGRLIKSEMELRQSTDMELDPGDGQPTKSIKMLQTSTASMTLTKGKKTSGKK